MNTIFDAGFMVSTIPDMLKVLPVTLGLTLVSASLGLVIGFGVALIRYFNVRFASAAAKVYISFVRGTPTMVQLLLAYYGVPIALKAINAQFGTQISVSGISPLVFATVAFSLNSGAYMSEIIRSSLLSVHPGQLEACYSVNMTTWQALRRVIIPQAFTVALPALGNALISLLKETSLVFNISVVELMAQAKIIGSRSFRFFEVYIVVSAIYWVICMALERLLGAVEKRSRRHERKVTQ